MNSYSFTFTIPPEKKVYYAGRKRTFKTLSQQQQYTLFCDLMTKVIWWDNFSYLDYVFEEHEDKRLHLHGYAIVKPECLNKTPVQSLRHEFYSHAQIIGMAMSNYIMCSDIQQTYCDLSFWLNYIDKHQDKIKFKSKYTQGVEDKKSLDNGVLAAKSSAVCQIETRPDNYYDTYRFKGQINKFLVEI